MSEKAKNSEDNKMESPDACRVRFAPSPTGYLHVGGARTALYNFLCAKKFGGQFVLRVEDTDLERSTEESMRMQMDDLQWLGLEWNEGPSYKDLKDVGEFGPYRQSQRAEIYQKYAGELLESGKAFYCFHSDEELEAKREKAKAEGLNSFVSDYRSLTLEEARAKLSAGEKAVVRFKNQNTKKEFVVPDLIRGEVKLPADMVGDFVIIRSNGMPVYNFCCVIDDHLMGMTHVLRAEEHLSNSLRQMMIYMAFDWQPPKFGHLSLILGEDRQKLSKRHGATSCHEYRKNGYLPEAMLNYLSLLGWSTPDGEEIFSLSKLIENFSLDRFVSSGAIFDEVKLKWVNAMHLRALEPEELWRRVEPFLDETGLNLPDDKDWREKAMSVFKSSMETLTDAVELLRPFDKGGFKITEQGAESLSWESSSKVVHRWRDLITDQSSEYLTEHIFSEIQDQIKKECEVKGKFLFMPLRVCVLGKPHGADLQKVVPLLKKTELLERANLCIS